MTEVERVLKNFESAVRSHQCAVIKYGIVSDKVLNIDNHDWLYCPYCGARIEKSNE